MTSTDGLLSVIDAVYRWPASGGADPGVYALAELLACEYACLLEVELASGSVSTVAAYGRNFPAAKAAMEMVLAHCSSWDQDNVCDIASLTTDDSLRTIVGVIVRSPQRCVLLCCFRRTRKPGFCDANKEQLRLSLPHWRRALQLTEAQHSVARTSGLLHQVLNQAPFGILLVDEDLQLLFCNVWARDMAANSDGIQLQDNRLTLTKRSSHKGFVDMLKNWQPFDPGSAHSNVNAISVERLSGAKPYRLLLMPMDPCEFEPVESKKIYGIFIHDQLVRMPVDVEALKQLEGLTDSEARMCEKLYQTHNLHKTAEQLEVSASTAKTHLLNTFRKLGINSQAELMRYLAHMPKFYADKLQ